jgi:hypothetical protein
MRGARHTDMKPHRVLRVVALALVIAASGCASVNPVGTNAGGPVSPSVFISSPPEPAMSSIAGTAAVGDAAAISQCQAAENARPASFAPTGGTLAALTVTAGFTTTEGDAHRYADSLGLRPGDPSPRPPAGSSGYYTSTTPVVVCILDGYIEPPACPATRPTRGRSRSSAQAERLTYLWQAAPTPSACKTHRRQCHKGTLRSRWDDHGASPKTDR